jgi:predicted FMN-binding regulatory protein PaiB
MLIGHVARANPIWTMFADEREVLALFQGAHAYVSRHWYASRNACAPSGRRIEAAAGSAQSAVL